MKRAALYGVPDFGAGGQKCYSALFSALEKRFGVGRVWQRSTKYFDRVDVCDEVAIAIVIGLRMEGRKFLETHLSLGTPTLVADLGWLKRDKYYQLCPGNLNVIPKAAPDDRFKELKLPVKTRKHELRTIVICGQVPGDAQHNLVSEADMKAWGVSVANQLREKYPTRKLLWRPHPKASISLNLRYAPTAPSNETITEFVSNEYVSTAVVYNSTAGLEFLREGCNVIALGERAVYSDVVPNSLDSVNDPPPKRETLEDLFARVAYGQYKPDELQEWKTIERLMELHQINGDW